jgi:hypothetical protein
VRVWLSQQQWMSVLESTERQASQPDVPQGENQRKSQRVPAQRNARCLIRLGHQSTHSGTFLVELRDISATGLGFYSAHPFTPKTRCTVALQDGLGHGLVCAAQVVWCRSVDDQLQDIGVMFDKPVDAEWLMPNTQEDTSS